MDTTQAAMIESIRSGPRPTGSFRLPRLVHARVEDAMHPGVVSVSPETPLPEAARVLSGGHIHCLIVPRTPDHNAHHRWGLITALDLVRAAADGAGRSFDERSAGELATDAPPTVSSDDGLDRAAQLMAGQGSRRWTSPA
jgi:CBS domain-containing protein